MTYQIPKNLHQYVLSTIREQLKKEQSELVDLPDKELVRMIFSNFRPNSGKPKGLQLTSLGFSIAKNLWEHWVFPIKEEEFRFVAAHKLWLEQFSTAPYFYQFTNPLDRTFFTFCPHIAMHLKLASGNLNNVISNPLLNPPEKRKIDLF